LETFGKGRQIKEPDFTIRGERFNVVYLVRKRGADQEWSYEMETVEEAREYIGDDTCCEIYAMLRLED
jgi:hypothetical protein